MIATAQAQEPVGPSILSEGDAVGAIQTAPVLVDGETLFSVRGFSAFTAEQRAQEIADHVRQVAGDRAVSPESLRLEESPAWSRIVAGDVVLMTVLDADAGLEGVHRTYLAEVHASTIRGAIKRYRKEREPRVLTKNVLYVLGATALLILALLAGGRLRGVVSTALTRRYSARLESVHIQAFQILAAAQLWRLLMAMLNVLWALMFVTVAYIYLHSVLGRFPWTRGLAQSLGTIALNPLRIIGAGLLAAIPSLVFLAVLAVITWYLLKFIHMFFAAIERGAITLATFDPRWAKPTNRLISLFVLALAAVVAYPYIPGSNSEAFKGISLFVGLLFSLGSTSLIGNLVSGYSLSYRRGFEQGDRVRIGDHVGDVEEKKLLVTYLRTVKNEIVTVPNSMIVSGDVVNFTTLAKKEGLILHTTVGIGYGTAWRQVEAMLREAARRTSGLLDAPQPFVLIKQLGDFAITYEINAYTDKPRLINRLYTTLHENILDVFNEYGVQIMTPAYEGDPEQAKVVSKDQWYVDPARVPSGISIKDKTVEPSAVVRR